MLSLTHSLGAEIWRQEDRNVILNFHLLELSVSDVATCWGELYLTTSRAPLEFPHLFF